MPGRYLVLVPGSNHVGVSRKIEDEDERERLRALVAGMQKELEGFIVRTAAAGNGETELVEDYVELIADLIDEDGEARAVDIAIGDITAKGIDPAAAVFVIARDPAVPSPPLAVTRRRAGDLPTVVTIKDSDAMVAGRLPSAYEQLEIIVRVSASGQPMAQPGDWFGQGMVRLSDSASIAIVVDQQVP